MSYDDFINVYTRALKVVGVYATTSIAAIVTFYPTVHRNLYQVSKDICATLWANIVKPTYFSCTRPFNPLYLAKDVLITATVLAVSHMIVTRYCPDNVNVYKGNKINDNNLTDTDDPPKKD